jgi:hypothetical protein
MEKIKNFLLTLWQWIMGLLPVTGGWYTRKYHLTEVTLDRLFRQHQEGLLLVYMETHRLPEKYIDIILDGNYPGLLVQIKKYPLTQEQQVKMLKKRNFDLIEGYLCPKGFLDETRRFAPEAELLFLSLMAEHNVMFEVFKSYVDVFYKTLLTDDVIRTVLFQYPQSLAVEYILVRTKVKKEQEESFVRLAPKELLEFYIEQSNFSTDAAELALVETHYCLAKKYFASYGFRPLAHAAYHNRRKAEVEKVPYRTIAPQPKV